MAGADEDSDFEVTWFYDPDCAGQDNLREFGLAKSSQAYAVRKIYADAVAGVTTPTYVYARVIFSGSVSSGWSKFECVATAETARVIARA